MSAYMEQFDRNNFMQNILLGNMLVVDMYNKAQKLHIEQAERVVFVIELEGNTFSTASVCSGKQYRLFHLFDLCKRKRTGKSTQSTEYFRTHCFLYVFFHKFH